MVDDGEGMRLTAPDSIVRYIVDVEDISNKLTQSYSFEACATKYYGAVESFIKDIVTDQLILAEDFMAGCGRIDDDAYSKQLDFTLSQSIYDRIESLYEEEEDDGYGEKLNAAIVGDGDILYEGMRQFNEALMSIVKPKEAIAQLYATDKVLDMVNVNVYQIGREDKPSLVIDYEVYVEDANVNILGSE